MKSGTTAAKKKGAIVVRTENYSHSKRRCVHSTTTTVLLKWQTQRFSQTMSPPANL